MKYVLHTGEPLAGNPAFTTREISLRCVAADIPFDYAAVSDTPLVSDDGQLNAADTKQVLSLVSCLPLAVASGLVVPRGLAAVACEAARVEITARLRDAMNADATQSLIIKLTDPVLDHLHAVLLERMEPLRLARIMLDVQQHQLGDVLRVYPAAVNIPCVTSDIEAQAQHLLPTHAQPVVYPTAFSIHGHELAEDAVFVKNPTAALDAFVNGVLQQILGVENRRIVDFAAVAAGAVGQIQRKPTFDFSDFRALAGFGSGAMETAIMGHDVFVKLLQDPEAHLYNTLPSVEDAFRGHMGSMAGVDVYTDGHHPLELRLLNRSCVMTGSRKRTGVCADIGKLHVNLIDRHIDGKHSTGIFVQAIRALAITNSRSVASCILE